LKKTGKSNNLNGFFFFSGEEGEEESPNSIGLTGMSGC
jgi:hypothetical protein